MSDNSRKNPEILSDEELDDVLGGYSIVFPDEELNRDSWFVSYVTRRMLQDSISRQQGAIPAEITVRGRRFGLTQSGDRIIATLIP